MTAAALIAIAQADITAFGSSGPGAPAADARSPQPASTVAAEERALAEDAPQGSADPTTPEAASASAQPAGASAAASALAADGIPSAAREAYVRAAAAAPSSCHIPWPLVAAIGRVESNHGRFAGAVLQDDGHSAPPIIGIPLNGNGTALIRDTEGGRLDGDPVYDRAVGPMQFIPSTWKAYAGDGDGDGRSDPFDMDDAAAGTAKYLCAAGGDLSSVAGQRRAVLAYNNSDSYVAMVLTLAATYAGTPVPSLPTPPAEAPPSVPPANPAPPPAVPVHLVPAAGPAPAAEGPTSVPPPATPSSTTGEPPSSAPSPTTQPPTTQPPTTQPPSRTPSTTTQPPSSTPPTTTQPPPRTPSATPSPSSSTTPGPSPQSTATPTPTSTPTSTPTPTPGCSTGSLEGAPAIVDIRNGSGDPAAAAELASRLRTAGMQVGAVTTTGATTSAVLYPDAQRPQAGVLAAALGLVGSAQLTAVDHVTVVIGAQDSDRVFATPSIC